MTNLPQILNELGNGLARSNADQRRHWAREIVNAQIPIQSLFPLLHGDQNTAQRMTWLITDIANQDKSFLVDALPMLFSLRDAFEFSGMHRSVAKWLEMTQVPTSVESEAIPQLLAWMENNESCIASKSFAGKALVYLVQHGRLDKNRVKVAIRTQLNQGTDAFQMRMKALLAKMD